MLRRLDLTTHWRSLAQGFWPSDLPLGARSVIYGHNGSGKSTLAELLLGLAEGSSPVAVKWEHHDGQRTSINAGGASPSRFMAVFTRKWVDTNLSAFLDGASASAIVTLGREAIDAKGEEARLVNEIQTLRSAASEVEKQLKATVGKVDKLVREVQDRIVSELKGFDYNHFTKSRFTVTRVESDLRSFEGEFPNDAAHAEALKRLGEVAPRLLAAIVDPPHRHRRHA